MIIGTAGHIDHGKTTLVRALTGVNTDRLKEEKVRGISIELGYAYTSLGQEDILGFVDVPGHEKLVHTMAAGAAGIDFGLLVIAADDGVMPQTREHLAILQWLGVQRGAVALTKCDCVDAARLSAVRQEVSALVAQTFLAQATIFPLIAHQNDDAGVTALKQHLADCARAMPAPEPRGLFRLAIDRVFTLVGHGTVVTGTVYDGCVRVADEATDLRLMPANRPVRVRSIHAQNRPSETATRGQRCALNLPGIDKSVIARGDWIADARCFVPSTHIDVELNWQGDTPLRAWTPLHVHLGATHAVAHAVPLEPTELLPGMQGWVQLVFDAAVCTLTGDRYIVRNAQASRTVGGGRVLDPNAPDRKRRSPARLAWLAAVTDFLHTGNLLAVLAEAPFGLSEHTVMRLLGHLPSERVPPNARWVAPGQAGAERSLILDAQWQGLHTHLIGTLAAFHKQSPDEPGLDSARLRRMACPQVASNVWQALLDEALAAGSLRRTGAWWHLADHGVQLTPAEQALAANVLPRLHAGTVDPPWVRDLGQLLHLPESEIRRLLRKLLRCGEVAQIVPDLFYHRVHIDALAQIVAHLCMTSGGARAAPFRDLTGLGRKRAIQILEYFDRVGYTRRLRDMHVLRADSAMFGWTPTVGREPVS